jgi:hypothetical protein
MCIPGFAAEASLYKPNQQYTAVRAFGRRANGVRTQLVIRNKAPGPQNVPGLSCDENCLKSCGQMSFNTEYCYFECCEYFAPRY